MEVLNTTSRVPDADNTSHESIIMNTRFSKTPFQDFESNSDKDLSSTIGVFKSVSSKDDIIQKLRCCDLSHQLVQNTEF